jgi:hypothetical protein
MLVEDKTSTAAIRPVGMECVDENRFTVSTDMLFSTNILSLTGQGCGMLIAFSTNMLSLWDRDAGCALRFLPTYCP